MAVFVSKRGRRGLNPALALLAVFALMLAACGGESAEEADPGATDAGETGPDEPDEGTDPASDGEAEEQEGTGSAELVEVDYFLPFLRSIAFWPTHLAEELGYFEEEGLDIQSEATDGSSFVVQQVAAGNAEFGIAVAEPVLLGYEQTPNFTSVYEFLTGNVFDIWATDASGIGSLEDLEPGAQVAVADLAGGDIPALDVRLRDAGLEPGADVDYVPFGENTAVVANMLANGEVDALSVSWNTRVGIEQALEEMGIGLECLTCEIADALGSESVIVTNEFLDQNRDLVVAHGRALAKATLFGQTNPDAALEIMSDVNPEEQVDEDYAEFYFERAMAIMEPRPQEDLYGWHDPEAWSRSMELLLTEDIPEGLTEPVDIDALINNDLVEEYNDFDHDEVIRQAEEWGQ